MKYFLLFTLIPSSAFAIDFHKVTGSFEVDTHEYVPGKESTFLTGSFETATPEHQERMPANVAPKKEDCVQNINEVTGTFR